MAEHRRDYLRSRAGTVLDVEACSDGSKMALNLSTVVPFSVEARKLKEATAICAGKKQNHLASSTTGDKN